jgi:hypothetical protein
MKNTIAKVLTIAAFGFILNSLAMAGEDVDAFTLSFQNNSQDIVERDVVFSKVSFSNPYISDHTTSANVLDFNYDSVK